MNTWGQFKSSQKRRKVRLPLDNDICVFHFLRWEVAMYAVIYTGRNRWEFRIDWREFSPLFLAREFEWVENLPVSGDSFFLWENFPVLFLQSWIWSQKNNEMLCKIPWVAKRKCTRQTKAYTPIVAKLQVFGKTVINNFFNDYRSKKKLLIPFCRKTHRFYVIHGFLLFPARPLNKAGKSRIPWITWKRGVFVRNGINNFFMDQ